MAKKRRRKKKRSSKGVGAGGVESTPTRPSPGRRSGRGFRRPALFVLALVAVGVAALVFRESPPPPPAIPDPDTSAMEPQVMEKVREVREAVERDIDSSETWGRLGMVFQAHQLNREAAACYEQARALGGENFRWPYLLAQVLKTEEPERALETVQEAVRLQPDYAPLYILRATLEEQANDAEAALSSFREALSADGESAAAHFGVGRLLLTGGDPQKSVVHLERAAELAPDSGSVQATLARAYRRIGDREKAMVAAERARRLHPDVSLDDPVMAAVTEEAVSIVGYQTRAASAEASGDRKRAESLIRRMIELSPDNADLYYNLANNLSRQGRMEETAHYHREALARNPEHLSSLINLGIHLSQRGELDEAASLYRRALAVQPGHAGALSSLGNVTALKGDLNGAARLFRRALDADPARPDTHYALAQVLMYQAQTSQAIRHFVEALRGAPDQGGIHVELAMAYAKLREFRSAWEQVQGAREYGAVPPPEFLARLRAQVPEPSS